MKSIFAQNILGVMYAQQLAERAFAKLKNLIQPEMTEREVSNLLKEVCLNEKDVKEALTDMVISGPNSAFFHRFADNRIIKKHELILIDFSIICDGWYSDMTRMLSLGKPSQEAMEICSIVEEAKNAAAVAAKPGMPVAELYQIAMGVIQHAGYGKFFPHRLGHGIGREMHKNPSISKDSKDVLSSGMVFSIEPGIYLPHRFGARLEDLYAVTTDSVICLNHLPTKLTIL